MTGSDRAILRMLREREGSQLFQVVSTVMRDREQLEVVLNSLELGVFVLDTDCHVLFINREGRRLLPLRGRVYRNRPVWNVVADATVADFLREHLPGQLNFEEREMGLTIGDQQRILRLAVGSLVREHKCEGCILTAADVTAEKYRLLQLRRAEKLASFTTAAAGMAHDIRNPLEAISIHLQLIEKRIRSRGDAFAEELRCYTRVIGDEVRRLDRSVQEFLSLTHQEPLQLREMDITQTIEQVVELLAPELRRYSVTLELALRDDLPTIKGSEQALQRAWMNLMKNAIQAMPGGGKLTIATSADDQRVYIVLIDSGAGVGMQHLERIFEPYYTTKPGGSGLGLTRVYHTVREHHGSIDISNLPEGGCRVSLSFPRAQASFPLLEERLPMSREGG